MDEKLPPERLMAKKLGVSRPSVREAYSALEIAGILESRAGSGTYVKSINIDNFNLRKIEDISSKEESPFDLLEVRRIVEPEIVALAAKNASIEKVKELEKILERMKEELKRNNIYSIETDAEFHMAIARASDNSIFFNIMAYISNLAKEKLWEKIREKIVNIPGHREKDIKYHESILDFIREKNAKNAKILMRKHFSDIMKEIDE